MAVLATQGLTPDHRPDRVCIPGGTALLGTQFPVFPGDGEGPIREMEIAPFEMTASAVTNYQFSLFVYQTGYKTEAERCGWSFVFRDAMVDQTARKNHVKALPWWCKVAADWLDPKGAGMVVANFEQLPVVHVSWNDAAAYAQWAGGRLPTEIQWEHAARGGMGDVKYPWGNDEPTARDPKCHFGQINAPHLEPLEIGPVAARAYLPNAYGLYNMAGNVWEWTADTAPSPDIELNGSPPRKILKGGSYMCHRKSCYRYRIAARISNTLNSSLGHTGFRLVFPL